MYTFKSRIRYSELGQDGLLTLNGVVNYLQDCSTFQSEDIGLGVSVLQERGKSWMLSFWQIDINRYPALGEDILVGTWAYDFSTMYGSRNFMIQDSRGEYLVKANSLWFLYDMVKMRPIKVTPEDVGKYGMEEKLDMEYIPRKIHIPKDLKQLETFPVRRCHLDTNHHVNNGQYIQMALEFVPEDFKVKRVRAEYKKAAFLEDQIIPYFHESPDGYTIILGDIKGIAYAVIELQ